MVGLRAGLTLGENMAVKSSASTIIEEATQAPSYKFEKERTEDARLIHGRFVNRESPGGTLKFYFKKWKGDKLERYELVDGKDYDLPIGVIKHLVNGCKQTEQTNKIIEFDPYTSRPVHEMNYKPRFSFVTSEFLAS